MKYTVEVKCPKCGGEVHISHGGGDSVGFACNDDKCDGSVEVIIEDVTEAD
jgi:hypothetical protein